MMKIVLSIIIIVSGTFALFDDFINEINIKQNLWIAGRNFPENTTLSEIRSLLGLRVLPKEISENIPFKYHEVNVGDLPESFDARNKWSNCKTIKKIADQSLCGSCWAVSTASAISDRICIHSNGKLQKEISAKYLMSCDDIYTDGCGGGHPYFAWLFWKKDGLVTGGPYGSKGCQPYPFPSCDSYGNGTKPKCPSGGYDTPKCIKACDDSKMNFEEELIYGRYPYRIYRNEEQIMTEIFTNGPVVAGFEVYNDFFHYKSGVYTKTTDSLGGIHAIRVIGWGVENGTKYWLLANSWNEDWGDKGLAKILRGQNECGIESDITAGLPKSVAIF